MYYIKGIKESIKSINQVVGIINPIFDLHDKRLTSAYHQFLKLDSVFDNYHFTDKVKFIDIEGLKGIASSFYTNKRQYFADNSLLLRKRLTENYFDKVLSILRERLPQIYSLSMFLIKVILINQLSSHTNGTTDDTLGLSSIDFKDNYDENDFIELIVHQMTHMLIFIDDRCSSHMIDGSKDLMIETGLKFKLGGTKFPAYLAFHSYLVGVEVLCFRKEMTGFNYIGNYHGGTKRIIDVCMKFKESLMNNLSLFTPRGKSFLYDSNVLLHKVNAEIG